MSAGAILEPVGTPGRMGFIDLDIEGGALADACTSDVL
jgi:hypothetical protein